MTNDIKKEIDQIIDRLPDNLEPIEKARYIYVELGKLFVYDLNILYSDNPYQQKIDYVYGDDTPINKYQTCIQISDILCSVLNYVGVDASVINRPSPNHNFGYEHEAVELKIDDDTKYILDLTLDLHLIQAGCQTMEFGFSSDIYSNYDILPIGDLTQMDKKLGIKFLTNERINYYRREFNKGEYSLMDKMEVIARHFVYNFNGLHEGKLFLERIFKVLLSDDEYNNCEYYNMIRNTEEGVDLLPIYIFNVNGVSMCYTYTINKTNRVNDNDSGLKIVQPDKLLELLDNGYQTRSTSLEDRLCEIINRKFKKR